MKAKTNPDSLSLNYSTLVIGMIITIIVLIIVFVIDKVYNFNIGLSDYISILSCGALTTGLVYTAIALQYNYVFHKERLLFDKANNEDNKNREDKTLYTKKVQLSFEISSEWFKGGMAVNVEKSRRFLQHYKDNLHISDNLLKFKAALEENESERTSLISILNYFESIALLLERDVIEEDCIKDAFKALFNSYYKTLKPFIDDLQRENKRYFKSFSAIATKWLY